MLALRFHGQRDIRLEELPRPQPGPGEVLVQVTDAGLSQTQVNEFIEGPFIINAQPHPLTGIGIPLIPCQEFGGTIVEVGEGVAASHLGDQVAVLPLVGCGVCPACEAGRQNLCRHLVYRGLLGAHGGFCGYTAVPLRDTFKVRSRNQLTFIEPLLVGVHSARRTQRDLRGVDALVIGAGAVGCAVAAVWKHACGARVTIHDRLPSRLDRAAELGFDVLRDVSDAMGRFEVVFDVAGKDTVAEKQAYELCFDLTRPGGTVMLAGTYFSPIAMVPAAQMVSEKTTLPSFAYDLSDVTVLRDWLPRIDCEFDPLISRVPLSRLIEYGYYEAELDKSGFTRIVTSEYE